MARFTVEEEAHARVAFGVLVERLIGSGMRLKAFVDRDDPYEWIDWDRLDVDDKEIWVDIVRGLNITTLEESNDSLRSDLAARLESFRETREAELWTIGERLGFGADDAPPTPEQIVERIQGLLTDLQNSAKDLAQLQNDSGNAAFQFGQRAGEALKKAADVQRENAALQAEIERLTAQLQASSEALADERDRARVSGAAPGPQFVIVWSEPHSDDISESPIFGNEADARAYLEGEGPEDSMSSSCAESKAVLVSGYGLKTEDRS